MDIFEDVLDQHWHEAVNSCDEADGGLQEAEIYYCASWHVNDFKIPNILGTFTSAGQITENITCKNRRSFEKLTALVDVSELSSSGTKSTLKFYILGLRAKLIGMKRKLNRMPCIFIVKDNNNAMYVIGNTISPAIISVDVSTGQKEEDNAGATISATSQMIFFQYKGEIPPYRESDFTDEFTDESY